MRLSNFVLRGSRFLGRFGFCDLNRIIFFPSLGKRLGAVPWEKSLTLIHSAVNRDEGLHRFTSVHMQDEAQTQ
jgi:hypothetical protein